MRLACRGLRADIALSEMLSWQLFSRDGLGVGVNFETVGGGYNEEGYNFIDGKLAPFSRAGMKACSKTAL